jgi:DNA polymerase III alpha subunit (gram-positive type)
MCAAQGVDAKEALKMLQNIIDQCVLCVGHNGQFDVNFLNALAQAEGFDFKMPQQGDVLMLADTQKLYHQVIKLPPTQKMINAGRREFKAPKLTEAYEYVFGETFDNAHDALSDVRATGQIYKNYAIKKKAFLKILLKHGMEKSDANMCFTEMINEDLIAFKSKS